MSITINGAGTITGVSVGGLPDGIVDADMIASNAITEAKLASDPQQGIAKAWVNFNGTGTIAERDSFNVASLTDNGTGNYTVTYTNAMPNANYAAVATIGGGSISNASESTQIISRTTDSFQIYIACDGSSGNVYTLQNASYVAAVVFGD